MKKISLFLITCLCFMALAGCNENSNPTPIVTDEPTPPVEQVTKISVSDAPTDVENYEPLGKYEIDIIKDGNEEIITLYTSAQRDMRGNLMWDDTQDWVLQVEAGGGVYELYEERIHGNAYLNVSDYYNDGEEEKVITLLIAGNTFNEIREYRFDGEAFVEVIKYTTDDTANEGIGTLYTSVPRYE